MSWLEPDYSLRTRPPRRVYFWGYKMDWMQIGALIAMGLMAYAMWPMVKRWRENPVEAQEGDWSTAIFILGLVALFVLMLIWSVQ